jgi:hypothetical protein
MISPLLCFIPVAGIDNLKLLMVFQMSIKGGRNPEIVISSQLISELISSKVSKTFIHFKVSISWFDNSLYKI